MKAKQGDISHGSIPLHRPTKEDLIAAKKKTVPDVIAPGLNVLFVGINPGLYTAAIGHHFGRPGNRFWPALYAGGFTGRLLSPYEELELLKIGLGITNIVSRATATAEEVSARELIAGGKELSFKINDFQPRFVCVLGIGAYRGAFQSSQAHLGLQHERLGGAPVWILPNPSGLNAHYQPSDLARLFGEFRKFVEG